MAERITQGDVAPDFDLSSTESALLTLRDEVPRTSVIMYVFSDLEADSARRDLTALAARRDELWGYHTKILGMAPAKMPALKELQTELSLPFPLLRDDRDFLARYGVEAPGEDEVAQPALFVIDRQQMVAWVANPVASVESCLAELVELVKADDSPTANYPKAVINRLVAFWVN
ncbi:MAG: redoxin domain-containing protein [Acidobacteriota bacterium]|nr:redoxin domain-containing protein [Acidobacteriota bacterium]